MALTKVAPAGIGSTPGDGYRIGSSFLHSTGVELTNANASGIVTAAQFDGKLNIGIATFTDDVKFTGASGNILFDKSQNRLEFDDSVAATFGTAANLRIYGTSSNGQINNYTGDLLIQNDSSSTTEAIKIRGKSGEESIVATADGSVASYYNNVKRLETSGIGATVTGQLDVGNVNSTGVITATKFVGDIAVGSSITYADNETAYFGTDLDGTIKHTGSNFEISNNTGSAIITSYENDEDVVIKSDNGSGGITQYFRADGSTGEAILYNYGNEKLKTTSSGATVTGALTATSFVGGLPITSGADNRVITASSASAIQGEANLTFNGSLLNVSGKIACDVNSDIDMSNSADGQLVIGGDGYTSAIALNDEGMQIYHNSASRAIIFGTNETERLKITSGGFLEHYGSASFVGAGSNYLRIGSSDAGGATLGLDGDSNGDGSGADYCMIQHATDGNLKIIGDNPANAADVIFYSNSTTERLRITSDGVLSWRSGSTPLSGTGNSYSINIYKDAGSGYGYLDAVTGSSNHTGWYMRSYHNGTYNNVIAHNTSDYTYFQTGGNTRLNITSGGIIEVHDSVTLSSNAPSVKGKIRISGTSNKDTAGGIEFHTSSGGGAGYGSRITSDSSGNMHFLTRSNHSAWSERVRITSAGDIFIGNTNGGSEAINMVGDGGGILISRAASGSPNDGQTLGDIGLNSYSSSQTCSSADVLIRGQADGNHSGSSAGSALLFFTKPSTTGPGSAPSERMRINKNGVVFINNTTQTDISDVHKFKVGGVFRHKTRNSAEIDHGFYAMSTGSGSFSGGYFHMKTDMATNSSAMFLITVRGYAYGQGKVVFCETCGYCYSSSNNIINTQDKSWDGTTSVTTYKTSDGYVAIRFTPGGWSSYYMGFWVDISQQNPAKSGLNHKVTASAIDSSSTYYA